MGPPLPLFSFALVVLPGRSRSLGQIHMVLVSRSPIRLAGQRRNIKRKARASNLTPVKARKRYAQADILARKSAN